MSRAGEQSNGCAVLGLSQRRRSAEGFHYNGVASPAVAGWPPRPTITVRLASVFRARSCSPALLPVCLREHVVAYKPRPDTCVSRRLSPPQCNSEDFHCSSLALFAVAVPQSLLRTGSTIDGFPGRATGQRPSASSIRAGPATLLGKQNDKLNPRTGLFFSRPSRCCTSKNYLWIIVYLRFHFHLHSAREQHVLWWYFNLRSVCVVPASGLRSDIVCAQGCFVRTDSSARKSFLWRSVLQVPVCLSLPPQHSQLAEWTESTSRSLTGTECEASPVLQRGCWFGKLWRRTCDFGGRSMHRHTCFPTTLPPLRIGVRLQPTPAGAAADQLFYPDSSRLVRRTRNSALRNWSPSSCPDNGGGGARVFW